METCLVALGSNLGDRAATLAAAVESLAEIPQIHLEAASHWHATTAVGGPDHQHDFLNAAVRFRTGLDSAALWQALSEMERRFGRVRAERWGPRSLDVDLLLFGERQQRTADLELPHPRMSFRKFVLAPAVEIASELRYPVNGRTLGELWETLQAPIHYVAIAGFPGSGQTDLAESICDRVGAHLLRIDPRRDSAAWAAAAKQLHPSRLPAPVRLGHQILISDYWLGDQPAGDTGDTVPAKLLISLASVAREPGGPTNRAVSRSVRKQAAVQSPQQSVVRDRGPGPLLELGPLPKAEWLVEAVAAVAAAC